MKEKGITLIALVITIIILLILTSVAIATLTGDNGIITKAMEAKEKTEQAQIEEQIRLAQLSAKLKRQGGDITIEDILEELEKQGVNFNREDNTITIDGIHVFDFEENNGEVVWENQGTVQTPSEGTIDRVEIETVYNPTGWTNENVTVTIKTEPNILADNRYTIKYSKDGGNWSNYATSGVVMESNGEVLFKVTDAYGTELRKCDSQYRKYR